MDAGDYRDLIHSLHSELAQSGEGTYSGESWRLRAYELARARLHQPEDFLDWVKRNNHWSFTMAEVMTTAQARPVELARQLLVAILGELREEGLVFGDGDGPTPT